jgi:ribosomal protein L35
MTKRELGEKFMQQKSEKRHWMGNSSALNCRMMGGDGQLSEQQTKSEKKI